jgi:hypothetical protein
VLAKALLQEDLSIDSPGTGVSIERPSVEAKKDLGIFLLENIY